MKIYYFIGVFTLFFPVVNVVGVPTTIDNHIKIDQFGYPCTAQKVAVISNPQTGYNSNSPFSPGTGTNNYQVRRWTDDVPVFSGTLVAWNGGATHSQSGDQVWWFDFSTLTTAGNYYIYDVSKAVASYQFEISDDVYANVLTAAMRMYFYQRCGITKTSANAGTGWADGICHNHPSNQDSNCMLYSSPTNTTTSRILSGGWHDAGDYNKYVNFAWGDLTDLLLAYSESPTVWMDNYNIPESGNGIPDVLDEIKWELDWLLKMQQSDGSVLSIVGNICTGNGGSTSPPSTDLNKRFYGPANTSAALSVASIFALAAIQYKSLGIPAMTTYANTLQSAAINAWTWANNNPNVTWYNNSNPCNIVSGEQETNAYGRLSRQLGAAAFLYKLTGNATYKTYFESNYNQSHLIQWGYAYLFESTIQDILLYYASLPGAAPAVASAIQTAFTNSMKTGNTDNLQSFLNQSDAYRAYMSTANYTWGSNQDKAEQGNMFMSMNVYGLDATDAANYTNAASGFVHYMHGVNPTAYAYLTNMSTYNAENSITSIYHTWFTNGSPLWSQVGVSTYGPAPGYISGGPNSYYALDGCCPNGCGSAANNAYCNTAQVTPPLGQPVQKAYKDWNTNWPQDSWQVTEPDLGYQAAYVRLLSKFVGTGNCLLNPLNVQFIDFSVTPSIKSAIVKWNTSKESNINHFIVEKSEDGIDYDSIGAVLPQNNPIGNGSYTFLDSYFNQCAYYRIKQVDNSNNNIYSTIQYACPKEQSVLWTVYPNPFSDQLALKSNGLNNISSHEVEIYDALGNLIFSANYPSEDHSILINTSGMKSGLYLIQVNDGNGRFTQKIAK